jgi:hypothetical protein
MRGKVVNQCTHGRRLPSHSSAAHKSPITNGTAACYFPRFRSLKAFGRRHRCKPHRRKRPVSETLNNLDRSTLPARRLLHPLEMMHRGECRSGLPAKGRMAVDRFSEEAAPYCGAISKLRVGFI